MSTVADLDVISSLPVAVDRRSDSVTFSHAVAGQDASTLSMASNPNTQDRFSTVVDLIAPVPSAHYLLLEGGSGYLVLEDGGKVVIF